MRDDPIAYCHTHFQLGDPVRRAPFNVSRQNDDIGKMTGPQAAESILSKGTFRAIDRHRLQRVRRLSLWSGSASVQGRRVTAFWILYSGLNGDTGQSVEKHTVQPAS